MTILRRIGAVIVGMIVAFLLVAGAEGIAHKSIRLLPARTCRT
ncbi:MAG TPA: hypothetical protein VGQ21_17875 [Thermoanaerobaculia bacterium]|jgi:hypothetical protein|nr:hypothetical protein [Thermoanaerobaculia bacterium]